ncbi:MAG: methylcrotonoyl-CoA carboxylase, partial [Deltaproteobacteria bacterium]
TGEEVGAEELGGGSMHTHKSGVCDHLADGEEHALQLCRDAVMHLGPQPARQQPQRPVEAPLHDPQQIYGAIPSDPKVPYDVHAVLAHLLDGSRLHPFKQNYGPTLVCGFAHIMGYAIGVVASNGVLFGQSATKGAHFVQLCEQRRVPLLFLQNITGFMVGKSYEQGGITKDGAKMVQAVACATVPKITLVIGASHGAGNYAMCGRGYGPNFMFLWPNARVSVMGASQAAQVLLQVKEQGGALSAEQRQAITAPVLEKYDRESDPYYGSSLLWDDGIIDPAQSREVVALALSSCLQQEPPTTGPRAPVFRM